MPAIKKPVSKPASVSPTAPLGDPESPSRIYGGESREDRHLRRREQFLDAGLELIGREGYRAASVRALCRQAKLTDRYFYESFETVEDVLIGVYLRENERLRATVLAAIPPIQPGVTVGEFARPALHAFFEVARTPLVARVLWFEVLGVSDRVNRIYRDNIASYGQMLMMIVRSLYKMRQLSPAQEELLAMSIVGGISQTTMAWIVSDFSMPIEDLVDVTTLILEGIVLRLDLKVE